MISRLIIYSLIYVYVKIHDQILECVLIKDKW